MRCVNCGWDNKNPNATACEKCGHPLSSNPVQPGSPVSNAGGYDPAPRPTVINTNMSSGPAPRPTVVSTSMSAGPAPRPTRIIGKDMDLNELKKTVVGSGSSSSCPQCGYPITGNVTVCPSCGYELAKPVQQQTPPKEEVVKPAPKPVVKIADMPIADTNICDKCGTEVPGDFLFCPKCGERIHQKTVMARRRPKLAEPVEEEVVPVPELPAKCKLTLIPEEDDTTEAFTCQYEGNSIILNRDNTEPTNRTITSKEQAELSFENGKWFVENRSSLGTTYIQVNRKFEIQPGDVIVLGDRRFTFEIDTASGE